jgi:hypothetical protein
MQIKQYAGRVVFLSRLFAHGDELVRRARVDADGGVDDELTEYRV